jgi:hypothetical protein
MLPIIASPLVGLLWPATLGSEPDDDRLEQRLGPEPKIRSVVHRLGPEDSLDGEEVLPRFRCRLADVID